MQEAGDLVSSLSPEKIEGDKFCSGVTNLGWDGMGWNGTNHLLEVPILCSLCRDWRQLFQERPLTFRQLRSVKMKPIHPWTGEAHIPVFSASLFVFALKWTPINLSVSCGWEVVCESVFYLCHLSALIYKPPAQPGCLAIAMCIGSYQACQDSSQERELSHQLSCVDTAFGISLEKGQERFYIPGMALLSCKNISSCTYFLEVFSSWKVVLSVFIHSWEREEKHMP